MQKENKLPRTLSLKSKNEISQLFDSGNKIHGSLFTLIWEVSDNFKYGIFVSKKTGSAVERNKIKRFFREAVRLNKNKLEKVYKLGFLPRKTMKPEFDQINAEVNRIFSALNDAGK